MKVIITMLAATFIAAGQILPNCGIWGTGHAQRRLRQR